MKRSTTGVLAVILAVSGCAVSPASFRDNPTSHSDASICRALQGTAGRTDPTFAYDLRSELGRRNISEYSCDQIIQKQNLTAGAILLIGAAIAVAASGGGGGNSYAPGQQDYAWDWDQFYNQYRQLVWACRGVRTGQFAEAHHCSGKWQTDSRWPSKEAL